MDFALFLLDLGDIDSSREKFHRILELNPDFAPAMFYLGEIAFDQGDLIRAERLFQQALDRDPGLPGPHYRMAQCALANRRPEEARTCLLAELELDIEEAGTLISMGSMFLNLGDNDNAIGCLLRATNLDMTNPDAHYYLGVGAANKGHLNDAAQFFAHALDLDPEHLGALRDSAFTYVAAGQMDRAAERVRRARTLLPSDSRLRTLDYSLRLIRLTRRITNALRKLDPRRLLKRSR